MSTPPPLYVVPLGGLGEIGMNLMAYEYEDHILVVDCGLTFPSSSTPGIDFIIPDVQYLLENKEKVIALVLTHGHEDHFGAIPYIWPDFAQAPVYGTAMTLGLLANKLEEHDLSEVIATELVDSGATIEVGPFTVKFIPVTHSIIDSSALAITTKLGTVIHTGDFKFDHTPVVGPPTDLASLSRFGNQGLLALLSDSTNVTRRGSTAPEQDILPVFEKIFAEATGLIIVAAFSSNIHRVQLVLDAAASQGRKVLINGRSMVNNFAVARALSYLRIPDNVLINKKQFKNYPRDKVIVISTGSQAEERSSLVRIAKGEHRDIAIERDDTVIFSSRFIPGNEQAINLLINQLFGQGAKVFHEQIANVHVSGHAPREDLKMMIALTRPRFFMPIHGELRHLKRHRELAANMGIPKWRSIAAVNGDRIRLNGETIEVVDQVPSGRIYVDGLGVGDVGPIVLRDRMNLSDYGIVVAVLVVDKESRALVSPPRLLTRGVLHEDENRELLERAKEAILTAIEMGAAAMDFANDEATTEEIAQRALRRFFRRELGRRPLVLPMVVEM